MFIQLNGSEYKLADDCSVAALVSDRGLAEQPCAVEVNRELVPKREHEQCLLHEGDVVEIVTLVGGG